jgi:DNA-binding NarL/FixJ family response regulator
VTDPAVRVVIAEDNYLVREGVRRLLEASGAAEVVAAVGDAEELLDAVARLRPQVAITDIRMPPDHRTEGIAAAREIRARDPNVGVIVLSQYADPLYAAELFAYGTGGLAYLLKDRVGDLDELLHALHEVSEGRSVVDPMIVERLLGGGTGSAPELERLTPRELDVLRQMALGRTNTGIGEALFLSESAVEKHVASIFAKLGLEREPAVHRRVVAVLTYLRLRS